MQPVLKSSRTRVGALLVGLLTLMTVTLLAAGHKRQDNTPLPPPAAAAETALPVTVAAVTEETVSQSAESVGTVQAALQADISAKVMARVAAVLVREGDRVRAGQPLVRLDSADLQAATAQAEAAVESAREAVKQARTGARIQTTQSSTRVEQAREALNAAREQLSLVMEGPRKQQKEQADAAVAEAVAALSQAKANLALVREGARTQQKLQAQQGVVQAEAQYRTAKASYDRYKSLYDQEVIPRQRFDEVQVQLDTAAAQYEIAKQQMSLVQEGARPQEVLAAEESVRQAEARVAMAKQQSDLAHEGGRKQEIAAASAQVKQAEQGLRMAQAATAENAIKQDNIALLEAQQRQAEAALRATRVQTGYTVISAAFDGVVTARLIDPGAMAAPGVPLLRVENTGGFHLDCTVPESRVARLAAGQMVPVTLESLGWHGEGRLLEIVPAADPHSRTFIVKVSLPSLPRLASGMFGKVGFAGESRKRLLAPRAALVERGQLESVFVVDEHSVARLRLVQSGEVSGDKVELLSGVQAGDRIVVRDAEKMLDGTPVRVAGR